jgi:uncharacterized repeat protein (TIGR02543 family)
MDGVKAIDPGDGDITDHVTYSPKDLDTSVPGIYTVTYEVTDTDGNTKTAERAVVVNDGRYVLGKGRILEASSFVIALGDVPTSSLTMDAHLLAMTAAHAYDGTTGEELDKSVLSISDAGGYGRTVGEYKVTVAVKDTPSGTVTKTVTAKVVDADKIASKPVDPGDPDGATVYTYGNNITLRISEASALVGNDAALLKALGAGASITNPKTGTVQATGVKLTSSGGFLAAPGSYTVQVADADGISEIPLTVTVTAGNPPTLVPEKPVTIPLSNNPYVSDSQIIGSSKATDPEDGNLTSKIKVAGDVLGNVPGIYQVTLSVTDTDGNTTTQKVAVVVDDGSFIYGKDSILSAKDFTIAAANVSTNNKSAQILSQSKATAAKTDGTPLAVTVTNLGGYTNAGGAYTPTIAVSTDPTVSKTITATVTAPATLYRVSFNPNGGWLTGPSAIYVQAPATTLSYLPSSPLRTGYTFKYWSTDPNGKTQFTASTPVTSNTTVYAQWEKDAAPVVPAPPVINITQPDITVNPAPVTVNPAPVNVYGGGSSGGTSPTYVSVTGTGTTTPATTDGSGTGGNTGEATTTTQPVVNVNNTPAAPVATKTAPTDWSLFDLLAVILAGLLLIFCLIKFFFDRRKDEEYVEEPIDSVQWAAMTPDQRAALMFRRESERQNFEADQNRKSNKARYYYVNLLVLLIVAALFVEALVMLFLTQDFSLPMTFWDKYSWIFALVFMVALIVPSIAAVLRRSGRKTPTAPTDHTGTMGTIV